MINIWSSLASSLLDKPHLTNDRMIIYFSSYIPDQAIPTHCQNSPIGCCQLLFCIKLKILWKCSSNAWRTLFLNGLWIATSSGCIRLVVPPGTLINVGLFLANILTELVCCAVWTSAYRIFPVDPAEGGIQERISPQFLNPPFHNVLVTPCTLLECYSNSFIPFQLFFSTYAQTFENNQWRQSCTTVCKHG